MLLDTRTVPISVRRRLLRLLVYALLVALAAPPLAVLALRWANPPVTAFMLRTHWQADTTGPSIHYAWVDMNKIAPALPLAVVAAEDQTFPGHNGFVWKAIGDAVEANLEGGQLRGASSITQQTAKNLFLWPAKSYIRKGIETYITVWMELLLSKRRILEIYVNIAQFGPTTFGARAASERFFGIEPARLSRTRAARLASVLPAPKSYDVTAPSTYVRSRQAWIERQMAQLGDAHLAGIRTATR